MNDVRVLVIGGPPGAGKTTLARTVAARVGFGSTTGDDLVSAGRMLTTAEDQPVLHHMRPHGHTHYFTEGPVERLIADAAALQDAMWPVFERVIRTHLTDKGPLVLDWWLFSPDLVATLGDDRVVSTWTHIDPLALEARERLQAGFFAESNDPDRMFSNFMQRSIWRNELVAEQARNHSMHLLHQPGDRSVEDLAQEVITRHGLPLA